MGMRIHKTIVYALNDVEYDQKKWRITDKRFADWILKEELDDGIYGKADSEIESFVDWMKKNTEEANDIVRHGLGVPTSKEPGFDKNKFFTARTELLLTMMKDTPPDKLAWEPIHEPEFGDSKLFGFCPLEFPDWKRHDDCLDYYDCLDGEVHIKPLPGGVYPYSHFVFLKGTLKETKEMPYSLDIPMYKVMIGDIETPLTPKTKEEQDKFRHSYRPQIPTSIMLWTHYLGIFKDWKAAINDFRPYLYTYWA